MNETEMGPAWVQIVSAFVARSSLIEIECRCRNYHRNYNGCGGWTEEMADACCRFRFGRVSIFVCGVQYIE